MCIRDRCLATGHLSREEIFHLVPLAKKIGVRSIVLTHPIYGSTGLTDPEMRQLTEYENVFAEMCYIFMPIDGFSPEEMAEHIRSVGTERIILSTDSGQISMEPPHVCMQKFICLLYTSFYLFPDFLDITFRKLLSHIHHPLLCLKIYAAVCTGRQP